MVAETTFTCQLPSFTIWPSGIGFSRAPGGMNVTPTRAARVMRTLHVDAVPRQAPAHVPNFQPVPGCVESVTLLPARTRTTRLQEAEQATWRPVLSRMVPLPVMATVRASA